MRLYVILRGATSVPDGNSFITIKNVVYVLDDLSCKGTEADVRDCLHSPWKKENCGDTELAGVRCRGSGGKRRAEFLNCIPSGAG